MCAPRSNIANVTLRTNAQVVKLNTSPTGREVTGVVVERDGATRGLSGKYRRRLVRRRQLGEVAADVG